MFVLIDEVESLTSARRNAPIHSYHTALYVNIHIIELQYKVPYRSQYLYLY